MQNIGHLTLIRDAELIAWHNTIDIQAVRTADGNERLYFNGKFVPLDSKKHHTPTQMVLNYCGCSRLEQMNMNIIFRHLLD